MLAVIDGKGVRFYSRNKLEWTDRFLRLASAVGKLNARDGVLGGQIFAFDEEGRWLRRDLRPTASQACLSEW
jgi:ATP-dependent DNA ligase